MCKISKLVIESACSPRFTTTNASPANVVSLIAVIKMALLASVDGVVA